MDSTRWCLPAGIHVAVNAEPTSLCGFGAWGHVGVIAIAVVLRSLGMTDGLLAAFVGYVLATIVGIVGIARTEAAVAGPLVYPFMFPGLLPLYYFATR